MTHVCCSGLGLLGFFNIGKAQSCLVAPLQSWVFCHLLASALQKNAFGSCTGISSMLLLLVYISSHVPYLELHRGCFHCCNVEGVTVSEILRGLPMQIC